MPPHRVHKYDVDVTRIVFSGQSSGGKAGGHCAFDQRCGDGLDARVETGDEPPMRSIRSSSSCSLSSLLISAALVVVTASCGGAAPAPVDAPQSSSSAPSPDAGAKSAAQDDKATKAAAVEALVSDESKKGACDEGHKAALEKLLVEVENGMKAKNGEDGKPLGLQLVARRVVPLGSAAKSIELAVTGRGTEVHVLAFGVKDVSLDVLVGTAAATTLRSPFQRTASAAPATLDLPKIGTVDELQSDSRQVTIKPGQPIVVKLTGQGCAAMVSFLKP